MLEHSPSFSRARTLLPGASHAGSALAGTGEADVSTANRLAAVEQALVEDPTLEVVAVHRASARSGSAAQWPENLDPRLVAALQQRGIEYPWTHQREAFDAIAREDDVVLATATASGKSLCFQVPILHGALRDPGQRALLLFPTKALARDQVEALRTLVHAMASSDAASVGIGVYDGDTPPGARQAVRQRAHVVASNPDMLHRSILARHEQWSSFLGGLRYLVLDEIHVYRGIFGSHVGLVLRRLLRLCRHYGANPRVIACSATIANPGELAQQLTGRAPVRVVTADAAPQGPKTTIVVNPRVVDSLTGVRRDYIKAAAHVASRLRAAQVATLAFCRTRKAVELLTRYLREDEQAGQADQGAAAPAAQRAIRGYRGGYLPDHRRSIEHALREGEARVVVSTNALELGMDIGGLDAVVLAGYPGSVAAMRQRAGRAGRRGAASLVVMVLSSRPVDQWVAALPGFLAEAASEHARIDPLNPEVFVPHIRCAAYELPLRLGEGLPGFPTPEIDAALEYLAARDLLYRDDDDPQGPRFFSVAQARSPADQVELRGTLEENFSVVDEDPRAAGNILAEVDFEGAPLYLHVGAIHVIEGKTYEVRRLDWDGRKAFVRAVDAAYYTEAVCNVRLRIVEPMPMMQGIAGDGCGYAHVVRTVPGFKKLRFRTHENIGFGPVHVPDLELHTVAAHWRVPASALTVLADPVRRAAAVLAVGHALHHVAALVLMCETGDLGHGVGAAPPEANGPWSVVMNSAQAPTATATLEATGGATTLYLYDRLAGGAGLSVHAHRLGAALFARVGQAIAGCRCADGCPTCLGPGLGPDPSQQLVPGHDRRSDALLVVHALQEALP